MCGDYSNNIVTNIVGFLESVLLSLICIDFNLKKTSKKKLEKFANNNPKKYFMYICILCIKKHLITIYKNNCYIDCCRIKIIN